MSWEIKIGTGAQEVTIDVKDSSNFQMSTQQIPRDDGTTKFKDTVIQVAGTVRAATDKLVADRILLLNDMALREQPQQIVINQNGLLWRRYLPVDFIGTPVVRLFQTKPDEGAGQNHWPFLFEIFMREGETAAPGGGGGAISTVRNSTVEMFGAAYVRKVWNISVTHKTRAQARSFILSRKPPVTPLRIFLTPDTEAGSFTGQFVWEASDGQIVEFVENPPPINEGNNHFVDELQVQGKDPVLHKARRRPHIVRFSGSITAVANSDGSAPSITAPQPHLPVGQDVVRVNGTPQFGGPVRTDPKNGLYVLNWEETYRITTNNIPDANHEGHIKPFALQEPGDGNFFN